jgi:hypothetical protein
MIYDYETPDTEHGPDWDKITRSEYKRGFVNGVCVSGVLGLVAGGITGILLAFKLWWLP